MKNNKGFTLIELLAVIVLLAVIATIAVPSIMGISKKTKESMLDTKLDLIKEDAKLYGQENLSELADQTTMLTKNSVSTTYPCIEVTVGELLEKGYLSSDKKDEDAGYVVNPVDNSSLNDMKIVIYLKNKRAATVLEKEEVYDKNTDTTVTNNYSCS